VTKKEQKYFLYLYDVEDPNYWKSLGKFIETFAMVEDVLNKLLTFYSKTTPKISRAIFSGTRCDASIEYIRRIVAVKDPGSDKKRDLEEIFLHLKAISTVRNFLVHYQSIGTGDKKFVSDLPRALTADRARKHRVSADILDAMSWDLYKIGNRLNFHRWGPYPPWQVKSSHSHAVLNHAWRYIPPQDHQTKATKRKRSGPRKEKAPRDQR
jgi:hypothetical protein